MGYNLSCKSGICCLVILFRYLLSSKPAFQRHDPMMVDVEEGEVGELLLGDEEEGVEHVQELGHVEQPGQVEGPQRLGVVGVVDGLAGPAVVSADVESVNMLVLVTISARAQRGSQLLPALGEAPQAEQGLEQVVADDDVLDVVRISVLHEPDYDIQ